MAKNKVTPEQIEIAEHQLKDLQRQVEYDTKDYTLELLLDKFEKGDFYIPDYQRQFVWKAVEITGEKNDIGVEVLGEEIDYLITEGYEHYGPKVYPANS